MAAGSTYTPIATQTVSGSSTGTVTFSSISSAYTDLYIACNFGLASASRLYLRFNGSSATNYSDIWLTGDSGGGTYTGSDRNSNAISVGGIWNGISTTLTATALIQVMNYGNTISYKNVISRVANDKGSLGTVDLSVGLWRQTSAITSVSVVGGANFLSGSTFTLYGIAAA
jgi:hypothetical protein